MLVSLALILGGLACRFSSQLQPTAPSEPGFLPLTAMAEVTLSPPPRRSCPVPSGQVSPPAVELPAQYGAALLAYLNQGGDATALAEQTPGLTLAGPDLDGDGWVDLAFSLQSDRPGLPQPDGATFVYHCRGETFELIYSALSTPERGAPQVEAAADATADGGDDLLITQQTCGAHTCFARVQLLTWSGEGLTNVFEGTSDDLPNPSVEFQPMAGNPPAIVATGGGYNSVGAGPYRRLQRTWTWQPAEQVFRQSHEQFLPSDYRIHMVYDADRAAADGDLGLALDRFQAVVADPALRAWVDAAQEQPVLAAYARFRQVVIALRSDDPARAAEFLASLRAEAQSGPGAAYLAMAEAFWSVYEQTGSRQQACQEAQAYAATHQTAILDPLYYGYANPTYTPADICPSTAG